MSALPVQVGGMGPGGKRLFRGEAWVWREEACSEGYLEGRGWLGPSLMGGGVEGKRRVLEGQNLNHMEPGPSFPSGPPRSIGECVHPDGWTP